ncbi:MAG TPA: HAD-IIA family hydrolase [Fimbriimonadaceae bacterium]|nr:HAD-IIA family hydrolase [Fimbriimonadaceae bacterium]
MPAELYIFDLDGTLFRGDEPIPGAIEAVERVRKAGKGVRYLTNNSSQTRGSYVDKLTRLGFKAHPEEIYSSAIGTAAYLHRERVKKVFIVGESGLAQTLGDVGIVSTDRDPDAVVVGICRDFTYELLSQAMQWIKAGAKFVATNTDPTYPVEGGKFIPGAGSIVAAVQICSEAVPFVVGKPNPFLIQLILQEAGVSAEDAMVIGDRMDTDIAAGERAKCQTLLVLTGAASEAPDGQAWLPSVADLTV